MSAQQISDRLKGAYQRDAIQNALNALTRGGILFTHKRGTMGTNGKGRASQRVVVACDSAGLIPDGWSPPLTEQETLSGGVHLRESEWDSQVNDDDSPVDEQGLSGDTDLPTHYGIHKSPTAATAEPFGDVLNDESLSLAQSDDASSTRYVINADSSRVDRIWTALKARHPAARKCDWQRMRSIARDVIATCQEATNPQVVDIADEVYKSTEVRFRNGRLDLIREIAERLHVTYTEPEREQPT